MRPYSLSLDVPPRLWLTCTGTESTDDRARTRARLRRRLGAGAWRAAIRQGARPVDRFMLLVAVGGRPESPVLAAETLKPLIDAGTDIGLWPDDDPYHRVCTLYLRDPRPTQGGMARVSMTVIPLTPGEKAPTCVVSRVPDARGLARTLTIPNRDWLTSNMREPPAVRQARQTRIMRRAARLWDGVSLGADTAVLCGVRYPDRRREYQGDPDNTAESATAMWGAGVVAGRLPANPGAFGFFLLDPASRPHTHDLTMLAFTTPPGFGWMTAMLG